MTRTHALILAACVGGLVACVLGLRAQFANEHVLLNAAKTLDDHCAHESRKLREIDETLATNRPELAVVARKQFVGMALDGFHEAMICAPAPAREISPDSCGMGAGDVPCLRATLKSVRTWVDARE